LAENQNLFWQEILCKYLGLLLIPFFLPAFLCRGRKKSTKFTKHQFVGENIASENTVHASKGQKQRDQCHSLGLP
jgi:hypothetical protein